MSDDTAKAGKTRKAGKPDPSTQPASAPYEPAARAWRGQDMGGDDVTLTGVEGGNAPESDEGAAAYAADAVSDTPTGDERAT